MAEASFSLTRECKRVSLWALHFAEYASLLAAALREHAAVQLVVYADNATNELGPDFRAMIERTGVNLEVLQRPRTPMDVLRNAASLVRLSKDFRPDVVHIQEDGRDELVLALAGLTQIPVVLTVHDPAPHSGHDAQRYRFSRARLYHKLLRRRADCAITHGSLIAKELARVEPRLGVRAHVIPHGPLGVWNGDAAPSSQLDMPATLLFFGRIHAYKGLSYFVEAVCRLRDAGVAVLGIVAGRGSDLEQHRSRMMEAGCFEIRDRYIDAKEVAELFKQTKIVVLPYTDATQSGVAAMAIGYGIPVVATAVGSIPDLVRHDFNGLLVPPRDVEALVAAIRQILCSPADYERLSRNALALKDGELSWRQIADKTLRLYRIA